MNVVSTRSPEVTVNFRKALFQGLAPDGGLYIPTDRYDLRDLFLEWKAEVGFKGMVYEVLSRLLLDETDAPTLRRIVDGAFSFEPHLVELEGGIYILELYHGPSSAFKDFGASFLASAMSEFLKQENRRSVILTATSGDTGSAVAQAFHGKPQTDVVILYPSGRVSPLQEKQLTTLGGNVHAVEVSGSFDDCQRLVKEAFLDRSLCEVPLTSANSINLGRLLPQSLYYIWAFLKLRDSLEDELVFTVPSGNFGNLTAGVYAWKWGLPVGHFLAATNENDVVPQYLRTGLFRARPSVATLSNAMDVGNPSNFERLENIFQKNPNQMASMIIGERVTDAETVATMKDVWVKFGRDICPHTAVGVEAARRFRRQRRGDPVLQVVLATAHPAKFVEVVYEATGRNPEVPFNLAVLQSKPKQAVMMEAKLTSLASLLRGLMD